MQGINAIINPKALYVYAKEQGKFQVAFSIALILILLSVIVNLGAGIVKAVFKRKKEM